MSLAPPPALPLSRRPRRAKVVRPPSQRAAARTLRRTAAPTTGRTWTRAGLPGPVVAEVGVPVAESMASCSVAALLLVPLGLFIGAVPAVAIAVVVVGGLSFVLWARRVVVGNGYLAVRRLGRYHVATVDHVRHLELKPTEHGGVLCVHTDDGRCMRLRRVELADPEVGAALRAMSSGGASTHDARVAALLELPQDAGRVREGYVASAG